MQLHIGRAELNLISHMSSKAAEDRETVREWQYEGAIEVTVNLPARLVVSHNLT